jgi:hypothetical protein
MWRKSADEWQAVASILLGSVLREEWNGFRRLSYWPKMEFGENLWLGLLKRDLA